MIGNKKEFSQLSMECLIISCMQLSFSRIFIISVIAGGILISLYNLIGIYIPKIALALVEQKVSTDVMIKVMVIVGVATLILILLPIRLVMFANISGKTCTKV